jgi:hypothetical protein
MSGLFSERAAPGLMQPIFPATTHPVSADAIGMTTAAAFATNAATGAMAGTAGAIAGTRVWRRDGQTDS